MIEERKGREKGEKGEKRGEEKKKMKEIGICFDC